MDRPGDGDSRRCAGAAGRTPGPFLRVLADLPAHFASPMIVGGRLAFISDHEGTGNIYSFALDGNDLRRHTDHEGWYARQASTDGQRVIYARGGELWLLDGLQAAGPVRLDITLGSPVRGRVPRLSSERNRNPNFDPRQPPLPPGAGQSPKSLSGEQLCSEGGVDAGSEAFSAEGATCLVGAEDVVAGVSDDGEVERRGVFSGSASVFVVQRRAKVGHLRG